MDNSTKFEFTEELQYDFIRYIIHDRKGVKAFDFIKAQYFTDLNHLIIVEAIEKFIADNHTTPSKAFHLEYTTNQFRLQAYANEFSLDEQEAILKIVNNIHIKGPPKNSEAIFKKIAEFSAYTELRDTVETVDLLDFNSYYDFSHRVNKAISRGQVDTKVQEQGTRLIGDLKDRQLRRLDDAPIVPTPFRQLNHLTSAGGYAKGGIVVILDQPKSLKTAFLVNWARGIMRSRKKCLYIDLENGMDEIATRLEQSVLGITKKELVSGGKDKEVAKMLRKYRRLGGEIVIHRLPAFSSAMDIQRVIDMYYREHGLQFEDLIIDYIGKMSSLNRDKDERLRIANAYIDVENLAFRNSIELVVTAHHVTRDAAARQDTKYKMNDVGKAIDIIQNVQVILGVNRSEAEREAGIFRLEIIAQRDGAPEGRCLFSGSPEHQRFDELTVKQVKEYNELYLESLMERMKQAEGSRPQRKQGAPTQKKGGEV